MGLMSGKILKGGKKKTDPGYGRGVVTLEIDDELLLDEDAVTQRLIDVFSAPDYRPPTLPSVATELMILAQHAEVSIDDVVELLERDTMLTGRVLKIASSAVYKGASELRSVKEAIVRLGLTTLRDLVLEASMKMRVFRADAFTDTMERLRKHSTFTGHLSRIVCRYTSVEQEYAFLCGLLHDVGVAGTLIALGESKVRKKKKKAPPNLIAIWPAIDRAHTQAGSLMAKLWELPPDVQMVLGYHHQVLVDRHPHPLAATICLADELAHELGVGLVAAEGSEIEGTSEVEAACLQSHTSIDRSGPKTLECAAKALDLNETTLDLIRADATALLETIRL
jgi:HD-like signal output (HDOD) protein